MALAHSDISNRMLKALSPDDFGLLQPYLERVSFKLRASVAEADTVMSHAYFIESGIVSVIADRPDDRIEVGISGREGMVGAAAAFGVAYTPYKLICCRSGKSYPKQPLACGHHR
jgi:CRP-like cAMP-binding protein